MLDPALPHKYPQRVLLAVSGMSPQVITETLYALAVTREPRWLPTRILVLTTTHGADLVRAHLLPAGAAQLAALADAYGLHRMTLAAEDIRVVERADHTPLADITTAADNEAMADAVLDLVRELTTDPDVALHVSLAGGRKTMSYYAGYALSLYGRAQDRLSHVLVSPGFESQREFFFPTPAPRPLVTSAGELLDAHDARVELAEIPFVRLRDGLPRALLDGRQQFSHVVHLAQKSMERPQVQLSVARGQRPVLRLGGLDVAMRGRELEFYLVLLRVRRAGQSIEKVRREADLKRAMQDAAIDLAPDEIARDELRAERDGVALPEYRGKLARDAATTAKLAAAQRHIDSRRHVRTAEGAATEVWSSRIRTRIKHVLGPSAARAYEPELLGAHGKPVYSLGGLEPEDIQIDIWK